MCVNFPCGSFLYCCVSVILLVLGRSCVGVMGFGVVALECGCEGGFYMAGGVLEELQRSCWGIWCGRLSNCYCSSILRKCKNVLLC